MAREQRGQRGKFRAGATDFGLEGQLVQKKGPWRKGPFLSEPTFIVYTIPMM